MDKISKALKKLTDKERSIIKKILQKIQANDFSNLDIKKLKAKSTIFRVRSGKIRIIFENSKNSIKILTIERRSDNTYK
jgi:mRNA-degrading endonuclease RelE of RelBE toxin-antitoxin system